MGLPDPATLFLREEGKGGHVVTICYPKIGAAVCPGCASTTTTIRTTLTRYVIIDTAKQTWSYDLGSMTWSGDANTQSLGIVPISQYAAQPVCPWCDGSLQMAAPDNLSMQEVWLSGPGHVLIADAQGRRLGYNGAQFIDEMPQAYGSFIDGGLGVEQEPIYQLPVNDGYTILLQGETIARPGEVTLSRFWAGLRSSGRRHSAATIDPGSGYDCSRRYSRDMPTQCNSKPYLLAGAG